MTELGHLMALLASRMPDIRQLVDAVVPNAELSEQAYEILVQMRANESECFVVSEAHGRESILVPRPSGTIKCSDQQFLHDDLKTLVELRLLRLDYDSQGFEMYYMTRAAATIVDLGD